jgi:hypothetical protein
LQIQICSNKRTIKGSISALNCGANHALKYAVAGIKVCLLLIRTVNDTKAMFGESLNRLVSGAVRVNKNDFMNVYDYGNPNHPYDENEEAIILYNSPNAYPSSKNYDEDKDSVFPFMKNVEEATENCLTLDVVLFDKKKNPCLAIVGGFQFYHIQNWMRVGEHGTRLERSYPLKVVGRGRTASGTNVFRPPTLENINEHHKTLQQYLNTQESLFSELKPILERIAIENTIIVMTCNFGQVTLLLNFVCSSKSQGFDLKNVLLFATDQETYDLANRFGLNAFYDKKNFGSLPSREARSYGDKTFTAMMYAKVVTVQAVNMLGYDVLFQDVDMFWYTNPLVFFHDKHSSLYNFDVLFSMDGAKTQRYAPYDANTGFYYVRYNLKTQYMLTCLLYAGDLIKKVHSHQAAFQAILSEHSSLFGLKVKTLPEAQFAGGHTYHMNKQLMKRIIRKEVQLPYIFHMSWTNNKKNKILYMKQMAMWFMQDQCIDKSISQIDLENGEDITNKCCSLDPLITCYYRDKPSFIPCKDSPPIDKGRRSFW